MSNLTTEQKAFCLSYIGCADATRAAKDAKLAFSEPGTGYHVYVLIDPANSQIFYVGKGAGQRRFDHERDARAGRVENMRKYLRISAIHARSQAVRVEIFANCGNEREAYSVERQLIEQFAGMGLTNMSQGVRCHDERVQTARDMLAAMGTFDTWSQTMNPGYARAIKAVWGELRAFYDQFAAELAFVAGGGQHVQEVTCKWTEATGWVVECE